MKKIILIILYILINISLFTIVPIKIGKSKLKGKYIGKYMEYLSEKELFTQLKDKWKVDEEFTNKMLSGILKDLNIKYFNSGYKAIFKSMNKNEYEEIIWSIDDIIKNKDSLNFIEVKKNVFYLNFMPHAYWLRFQALNETGETIELYLELDKHFYGAFDIFIPEDNNYIIKKGSFTDPLNARENSYKNLVHSIKINPGLSTFYIRLDSNFIDIAPIRLWTKDSFIMNIAKDNLIQGIIIGIFIIIFCYSIFVFLSMKNKSYIFLSLMILASFFTNITFSGFGFQYIWQKNPFFGLFLYIITFPIFYILFLLFSRIFIETYKYTPIIDLIIKIIIIIFAVILLYFILVPVYIIYTTIYISILVLIIEHLFYIPVLISTIIIIKKGNRYGIFLLIGIILYFVSQVEFLLTSSDIIPYKLINYLNIRIILFIVLITLGVSYKINLLKRTMQKLKEKLFEINLKIKHKKKITDESILKTETVKEFINKNYADIITRDNLAYAVGLSPDHLGRIFKQITGEKISDYINRIRIDEVKKRLKDTRNKIIDIAFNSGFENLRTFNKIFLNYEGISPKNFRNKAQNKKDQL